MGVLRLPPTSPQPRIAFSLLKRLVKIVVWLLATCERLFSNSADSPFHEPKYVRCAMRFVVGDATCHIILGDMFEDYRTIQGERGKADADSWLCNELVETLVELIWRPSFVCHFLISIRRLASFGFLRRTASLFDGKAGNSLAINNAVLFQPTIRFAFAMLIMLLVPILIFYSSSRWMTYVKESPDKPVSSELVAQNVQTPTASTQTVDLRADAARNSVDASRLKSKQNIHRLATTSIAEIMLNSNVTRGPDNKVTTIPRFRTPALSMKLPEGSQSGLYDVTLRDADENVVFSSTGKSVDGKKIRLEPSVQKLLQKLPNSDYHFSLSDRSDKNGSRINFQFVLSHK